MEALESLIQLAAFVWKTRAELLVLAGQHILISWAAILLGAMVAIPLGIFVSRHPRLGAPLVELAGMLYTVPSLALLGILIPFTGLGWLPAITALVIYSLLPLLRNTYIGISEVDVFMKEAAIGMGATKNQVLWRVEIPLAMPIIMAGFRTVAVLTIGITTLAALTGAGGLGIYVFMGLGAMNNIYLLSGTIPIAIIAIASDELLGYLERRLQLIVGKSEQTV
jgi:osmoprotectant transport system permease protein